MNADFARGLYVHVGDLGDESVCPVSFACYPMSSPVRLVHAARCPMPAGSYDRPKWSDLVKSQLGKPLRKRQVERLE
jgi:hypothetical protein